MNVTAQRVLDESKRFRARLPELVPRYDGRWVVFLDGDVKDDFEGEEEAYVAAVRRFGVNGGFVIARVAADASEPIAISATLFFAKL